MVLFLRGDAGISWCGLCWCGSVRMRGPWLEAVAVAGVEVP